MVTKIRTCVEGSEDLGPFVYGSDDRGNALQGSQGERQPWAARGILGPCVQ